MFSSIKARIDVDIAASDTSDRLQCGDIQRLILEATAEEKVNCNALFHTFISQLLVEI